MVGVIVAAPDLCRLLRPGAQWLFGSFGASPAVLGGMLLACDMGGFSVAEEMAKDGTSGKTDYGVAFFCGGVLASVLGVTTVFNIPLGLQMIKDPEDRKRFSRGILIG